MHTKKSDCLIIIAAYNVEQYIQAALRSVQSQTWQEWEAIVVDDGSSDKTADKIKDLRDSNESSRDLVFPSPRSNPFVE